MKFLLIIWRCVYFGTAFLALFALYRDSYNQIDSAYHLPSLWRWLQPLWLFVILIECVVQWRLRKSKAYREPSPARSAVGVVVIMGATFLFSTARVWLAKGDYAVPIFTVLATIAIAFIAYRFASRHAGEIGEARFDTTSSRR
ncbi:hypothetical protein [Novosphingobium sp.]|uniref:hypothetical protein n=1 Tax=Novosphingobium sp. TaxID=1874826 RepID=UPI0025FC94D2|nr:hypothetical protein [Novosphingobium sp.]